MSQPDILTVIAATVPLKRRGSLYFGKCPFHNEKTQSFCVYPTPRKRSKPFYHCFGCGADGDIIEWIIRTRRVKYREALRILGTEPVKPDPAIIAARRAEERREQVRCTYRNRHPDCSLPEWAIELGNTSA